MVASRLLTNHIPRYGRLVRFVGRGAVVLMLALGGCGDGYMDDALVEDYCTYGAQSQAQLDGCIEHVTPEQVRQATTPAARWARDGGDCLQGSGRFCRQRLIDEGKSYNEDLREGCEPPAYSGGRGSC